jgi:hypothetical protein
VIEACYHEAGHALVARAVGRPLELVAVSVDGGLTKTAGPLAADRTDEELEKALTVILAGEAAERYAPTAPSGSAAAAQAADSNGGGGGGDAYSDGLVAMMTARADDGPTDAEVVARYREDLGDEAFERAWRLAHELVDRKAVLGQLELVADRLYLHGVLTSDDLDRILAPAA